MNLPALCRLALQGQALPDSGIRTIIDLPDDQLPELLGLAHAIKTAHLGPEVGLCAIINAKSGTCSEDCSFCAQSGHHAAQSPEYPLRPVKDISRAAEQAARSGATRFGIVASGKLVGDRDLAGYIETVRAVAATGLQPDLSPGLLDSTQLTALRKAGLRGYHHNLETSASFFPKMCTTHTYAEDVAAVRNGIKAGLYVCSGGIFGIGESWDDRVELALLLRELDVPSIPMNFLTPIPGTPLEGQAPLSPEEALKIVALFRFLLPDRALRICGGRLTVFGLERKRELLKAGASGLMIGDYLTTQGAAPASDLEELRQAGLSPAKD